MCRLKAGDFWYHRSLRHAVACGRFVFARGARLFAFHYRQAAPTPKAPYGSSTKSREEGHRRPRQDDWSLPRYRLSGAKCWHLVVPRQFPWQRIVVFEVTFHIPVNDTRRSFLHNQFASCDHSHYILCFMHTEEESGTHECNKGIRLVL